MANPRCGNVFSPFPFREGSGTAQQLHLLPLLALLLKHASLLLLQKQYSHDGSEGSLFFEMMGIANETR